MRQNILLRGGLVAILALTLTGCGGGGSSSAAAEPAPTAAASAVTGTEIMIRNFKFVPDVLRVSPGQMITVTNSDSSTHTITAEDGSFDSKMMAPGDTYSFAVANAGTFPYICDIHQYMTGKIIAS